MRDNKLFEENARLVKTADELLADSGILEILKKFGQVIITGGYKIGLLVYGDIDIYVVNTEFTKEKALAILSELVQKTKLNVYILGDWINFKDPNFPSAYYLGLKTNFGIPEERWKIDIWLLTKREAHKRDLSDLITGSLSDEQRETILRFKKYIFDHNLKISGYFVYRAVLQKNILQLNKFKKFLKTIKR